MVWAELSSTFEAVVVTEAEVPLIGQRPYVPDHKIYFADFTDSEAAYFVCALLNSSLVREYIDSHTIKIQVSTIFKHLSIPRYSATNPDHKELAEICKQAHAAVNNSIRQKLLADMDKKSEDVIKAAS